MSGNRKKLAALGTLMLLWCGLIIWIWLNSEAPVSVPLANRSGPATALHAARRPAGELRVKAELLASARTQRDMTFTTPRNIFALPISGDSAGLPDSDETTDPSRQAKTEELAQYHYVGFVRTGEAGDQKRDLAVLTKNDDLHLVRKGETVENRVIVKAITQDSVTLQDRDSKVEYKVPLSEEAAPAVP